MSNRYSHSNANNRQDGNTKYIPKTKKNIVPKHQNPNPTSLSSSLRQSDIAPPSGSRVRKTDNGDWVPVRPPPHADGNFVNYLPQDEAVAAGLGPNQGGLDPEESQGVVDLLNRELTRLLKLNAREFWREVARDASLLEFLDSFLQFRSRWYDFPHHGAKGIVAGVIVGEIELSRRVFMLLYRISSNRDPGARAADSLSQKDHGALLQEKKFLDLPKLLDICAIYGHENESLIKSLVENALLAQPWILDGLTAVLSHFLGIVHTMHQRCSSSLEVLFSSGRQEKHIFNQLHADFLEVMDFINDGVVSLDAFVTAYRQAAVFFSCPVEMSYGNEELLSTLAQLHDSFIPSLQRGLHLLSTDLNNGTVEEDTTSLKMLSMRMVKLGWNLLDICYLSNDAFNDQLPIPTVTKIFPASVEDPIIRTDILVQTFRELSGVPNPDKEIAKRGTFLQKAERHHNLMERLKNLQNTGWIYMEDEQLQYLLGITKHSSRAVITKEQQHLPSSESGNKALTDEDQVVIESKISQIKDLFPDLGKGFLQACLEVYNQNPEEVIQRILEGTLHNDLQQMDTSLETMPKPKSSTVAKNTKDKGKGKLIESTSEPSSNNSVGAHGREETKGPVVSSSSSSTNTTVGRFVRKSKDLPSKSILDTKNEMEKARNAALVSQYEYDDEYDDSFDDLGYSVADTRAEESEKYGNIGISSNWGGAETEASSVAASASKWGSKKKPQFYVKDGKNYSYKVSGSIAAANANEATLINNAQEGMIHGLGRGGNIPLGASKRIIEYEEKQDNQFDVSQTERKDTVRGRGRGQPRESHEGGQDNNISEGSEFNRGNMGSNRGRGRRGGRNNYRKDAAMRKHFAGAGGF